LARSTPVTAYERLTACSTSTSHLGNTSIACARPSAPEQVSIVTSRKAEGTPTPQASRQPSKRHASRARRHDQPVQRGRDASGAPHPLQRMPDTERAPDRSPHVPQTRAQPTALRPSPGSGTTSARWSVDAWKAIRAGRASTRSPRRSDRRRSRHHGMRARPRSVRSEGPQPW